MSPRPLLLFVAAIALAAAGTASGILLFKDNHSDASRDRLQTEATDLALDALAWARTPSLLGGGQGTFALSQLDYHALGITPNRDAEGDYVVSAEATFRFKDTASALPYVEATNADGQPVIRMAIYGPDAACIVPFEPGVEPNEALRPANCSNWR